MFPWLLIIYVVAILQIVKIRLYKQNITGNQIKRTKSE